MKFLITNKSETHLMSINVFNTEEDAKKAKTKYSRFWGKFNKKNPNHTSPRENAWKTAKIREMDFKNRFSDVDIVVNQDKHRSFKESQTKTLREYDSNRIQKSVNLQIENNSRVKLFQNGR